MKVTLIEPSGYCFGVNNAISIVKKIRDQYKDEKIYIYGMLVHNQFVIDELKKMRIITLNKDEDITKLDKGIIISTAHGISDDKINFFKQNGFIFFDTTCPIVKKANKNIKHALKEFKYLFYLGKKDHPETIASLSISNNIILITKKEDVLKYPKDEIYALTSQTTMTSYEVNDVYDFLINNGYKVHKLDDVCNATTIRQKKLIEKAPIFDYVIIVGDKKSNNNTKLYELSLKYNLNSYFISNISELQNLNLDASKTVLVSSGTSTPNFVINEIVEYLKAL